MARDAGDRGTSKSSTGGPSRREVIVAAAGAGMAGILPETAGAHTIHRRHHHLFDATMLKNSFCAPVAAFNAGTASSSPQLFDPHVEMDSVKYAHKYKGFDPADSGSYNMTSVKQVLQQLAFFFPWGPAQFVPLLNKVNYHANTGLVNGAAYWHDNDGSPDDQIQFQFYFNSSYLVTLMRGTPGSGYKGSYPPPSDCP